MFAGLDALKMPIYDFFSSFAPMKARKQRYHFITIPLLSGVFAGVLGFIAAPAFVLAPAP
jgi:hypothetical protein